MNDTYAWIETTESVYQGARYTVSIDWVSITVHRIRAHDGWFGTCEGLPIHQHDLKEPVLVKAQAKMLNYVGAQLIRMGSLISKIRPDREPESISKKFDR